jgi:TRAP-type C4-dicarboxylate transport system permease small subunit
MHNSLRIAEFLANALASIFLVGLMMLTFADVLGRNVFNHPLLGATELTEYTLVAVTFLAYPIVAYRHGHVTVDLFDRVFGEKGIRVLSAIGDIFGAGVYGILAYRMWMQGNRLLIYGDITPQLGIPVAPAYFFMSIMAGVTALAFILAAIHGPSTKEPHSVPDEVI